MPFLEIARLSKSFGSKEAVGDLSFTVGEGRCAGLLGPNGAGKTTTLLMLAGLLPHPGAASPSTARAEAISGPTSVICPSIRLTRTG